ncbi:hypothetical protein [Marinobacter adhaerens]|uniref:hypothetical protein n=1 Tax=Marinobacter adhaerens TaxID=1033846 RepID=UPI001C56FB66|nr:hypothetical protein [Marinobacter adhaerens]MBW3225489.1 hypothetical protein [Marinobacter adhaerens]
MRVNTQVKPGFFWKAGRQYIALSEVPRMLNLTASEVADAVALGELQIERVSGCKVVSTAALFDYIGMKEGKK